MSALGAAPSLVDRLSETLDALRRALPTVALQAGGTVPFLAERPRVLESLRAVLDHISKEELDNQRWLSGGVIEYRTADQAAALQEVLLQLQHGWERRIASKLGPQRVAALLRLLEADVPDFLDLLGCVNDENANSDVLAWLLSPRRAPVIAAATLHRLVTFLEPPEDPEHPKAHPKEHREERRKEWHEEWQRRVRTSVDANCLSVRRELVFGREWSDESSEDRLDLMISGPALILVIENKLWSPEHAKQTEGYSRWLSQQPGLTGGLFLSPTGAPPLSKGFQAVSYMDLLGCLLEAPAAGVSLTRQEEIVLGSYLNTLARRVLRTELRTLRAGGGPSE